MKKDNFKRKAGLLAHHLRPAASAFALGIFAAIVATLLRTLFTQIIRFTVDTVLLGETGALPAFLSGKSAAALLTLACAAAAVVAVL